MELVLLYRGLSLSLFYCTEGCDGACFTVQRVVMELFCTEGCGGACLTSYKELSSSNKGS